MLLPHWVHGEVAAAFLLHLIVCQAKHQVHQVLYTYIPRESRVQLNPISNQFLQLLYIQISNAFLRVWLPPLWPLTFVSLKDISVPGVTPSIPRSSPHRPLHKQSHHIFLRVPTQPLPASQPVSQVLNHQGHSSKCLYRLTSFSPSSFCLPLGTTNHLAFKFHLILFCCWIPQTSLAFSTSSIVYHSSKDTGNNRLGLHSTYQVINKLPG